MFIDRTGRHHANDISHATNTSFPRDADKKAAPPAGRSWGDKIRRFAPGNLYRLLVSRFRGGKGPDPKSKARILATVGNVKTSLGKLHGEVNFALQRLRPELLQGAVKHDTVQARNRSMTWRPFARTGTERRMFRDARTGHLINEERKIDAQGRGWTKRHDHVTNKTRIDVMTAWRRDPLDPDKSARRGRSRIGNRSVDWTEILDHRTNEISRKPSGGTKPVRG